MCDLPSIHASQAHADSLTHMACLPPYFSLLWQNLAAAPHARWRPHWMAAAAQARPHDQVGADLGRRGWGPAALRSLFQRTRPCCTQSGPVPSPFVFVCGGGGGRSSICLQRRRALAACVLLLHSRRAPGGQKLQARESALKPHARESALTVSLAVAMQAAAASKAQSAQPASASESPGDQGEPCAGAHGQVASGCAHAPAPQ